LYYDLALLCEEQVKQVDILHETGNADKYAVFQKELDMLRQSYDIQRRYCIGRIYYGNKEYVDSSVVFESLQSDCRSFLEEFEGKDKTAEKQNTTDANEEKLDEWIGLSRFLPLHQHIKWITSLLNECRKLAVLSKAKVILDIPSAEAAKECLKQWEVKDMGMTLYPLLPKPVVYDLAWNYVEYEGIVEKDKEKLASEEKLDESQTEKKPKKHHRHDTDESPPPETKEEQPQESRKKWFGIF